MTKSRVFLWGMMAFVAGVAVRSFAAVPYAAIGGAAGAAVAAAAAGFAQREKKYAAYGFFLLAFIAGMARFDLAEQSRPDLTQFYARPSAALGIVAEDPSYAEKSQRVKLKITEVDGRALAAPFFVLATTRKYPAYAVGDELKISGRIEQPENFSNFDYVSHLRRDAIFAVMSFPQIEKIGEGNGNRLMLALSRTKHAFEENIDAALPEPHAAFMNGLLLGERASIPQSVRDDFQTTGVSHIVALSGYNITLIGRNLMGLLLWFTAPFAASFWIATAAIFLFVLMTGAAASVVRAGIMGVFVLIAQKEGRPYQMTNALAFAGAAMIFQNPYILRFDAGFQLSFLATIGLVYLSPHVEQWFDRIRLKLIFSDPKLSLRRKETTSEARQFLGLKRIFVETLSAQITVLPLLIYLFGRVSLVSPFANLAVLIAVPYSMAAGFGAGAAGFLSRMAGDAAGWAAWVLLEYQLRAVSFFARLPAASVEVGAWTAIPLLIAYGVVFLHVWKKSNSTEK